MLKEERESVDRGPKDELRSVLTLRGPKDLGLLQVLLSGESAPTPVSTLLLSVT